MAKEDLITTILKGKKHQEGLQEQVAELLNPKDKLLFELKNELKKERSAQTKNLKTKLSSEAKQIEKAIDALVKKISKTKIKEIESVIFQLGKLDELSADVLNKTEASRINSQIQKAKTVLTDKVVKPADAISAFAQGVFESLPDLTTTVSRITDNPIANISAKLISTGIKTFADRRKQAKKELLEQKLGALSSIENVVSNAEKRLQGLAQKYSEGGGNQPTQPKAGTPFSSPLPMASQTTIQPNVTESLEQQNIPLDILTPSFPKQEEKLETEQTKSLDEINHNIREILNLTKQEEDRKDRQELDLLEAERERKASGGETSLVSNLSNIDIKKQNGGMRPEEQKGLLTNVANMLGIHDLTDIWAGSAMIARVVGIIRSSAITSAIAGLMTNPVILTAGAAAAAYFVSKGLAKTVWDFGEENVSKPFKTALQYGVGKFGMWKNADEYIQKLSMDQGNDEESLRNAELLYVEHLQNTLEEKRQLRREVYKDGSMFGTGEYQVNGKPATQDEAARDISKAEERLEKYKQWIKARQEAGVGAGTTKIRRGTQLIENPIYNPDLFEQIQPAPPSNAPPIVPAREITSRNESMQGAELIKSSENIVAPDAVIGTPTYGPTERTLKEAQKLSKFLPEDLKNQIIQISKEQGVDPGYMLSKAAYESKFKVNAKNKGSTASGLYQFIDDTAKIQMKKLGIDPKDRMKPETQIKMAINYAKENAEAIKSGVGKEANSTDLYLAHLLGTTGAVNFLNALKQNPNAKPKDVLSQIVIDKNPVLNKSNVQQIYKDLTKTINSRAAAFNQIYGLNAAPPTPIKEEMPENKQKLIDLSKQNVELKTTPPPVVPPTNNITNVNNTKVDNNSGGGSGKPAGPVNARAGETSYQRSQDRALSRTTL